MDITSLSNDLVKQTIKLQQKKYRTESGLFLLEGYKSVYEAVQYGIDLKHVFVLSEKSDKYDFVKTELINTTEAVLKKISTTDSAPEVVAVAVQKKNNLEELKNSKKVILLENISDAGNLGTIIRSATAFNIDTIILYGDTVDLYNPKCVRASVGNLWKIPVFNIKDFNTIKELSKDFTPIATLPRSENTVLLKNYKSKDKQLIMFGTESSGLSNELINYAEKSGKSVTIEMTDKVESLNLSISVGVVLYKMFM